MLYIVRDKEGKIVATTTAKLRQPNEQLEEPNPVIEVCNTGVKGNTDVYKIIEALFDHIAECSPNEIIEELQKQHPAINVATLIE